MEVPKIAGKRLNKYRDLFLFDTSTWGTVRWGYRYYPAKIGRYGF